MTKIENAQICEYERCLAEKRAWLDAIAGEDDESMASSSALPYRRAPPAWLKTTPEDVVDHIIKLARKGLTPSQIGVTLRDSHGIPQVRFVTGNKILRVLKGHVIFPSRLSSRAMTDRTTNSEQNEVHVHNSGAMFPGASNFIIKGSPTFVVNQHMGGQELARNVPTGYKAGMTDLGPASPFFTGRKEILSGLSSYFSKESASTEISEQKIFVLYGMGGAGKTQTALKFINTFRRSFTQCYMIAAHSEDSIKASYYDIALKNGHSQSTSWEAGCRWLTQHEEEWIILYDNADDPEVDLGQFLPQANHGNIIITSRNGTLKEISAQSKELTDMDPDDGVQLLLKHAIKGHEPTSEEASMAWKIAHKLHYFALALVHAGSYILRQNCLTTYLQKLEKHQLVLMSKKLPQSVDKYPLSIYATWNLSWDKLNEACKTFLQICSCFHYEGITRELFQRALDNFQTENGETLAASPLLGTLSSHQFEWDELEMDEMIETISSYSLISFGKEGSYSLHPLIHQWIGDSVDKKFKRNLQLGAQSIIAISISGAEIAFLRSLVPHCFNFGITEDAHTDNAIAQLWFECGHYAQAHRIWEALWHNFRQKFGMKHIETLKQMNKVAKSLGELGKYEETLEIVKPLVEMTKELLGDQHSDTLSRMEILGTSYSQVGRYSEALEILKPLVEISKQVLGEQDHDTLLRMRSLAISYFEAGKYSEALHILEPLVDLSKQVLGDQHLYTLSIMQSLSASYHGMGRYEEALQIGEPLVETSKQVLGEEHPKTLNRMQNLALSYSQVGRFNEALQIEEALVKVSKDLLGEQHPETFNRMQNLAMEYSNVGRYEEAVQIMEPLVKLSKQVLGETHPNTLSKMQILAISYSQVGKYNEALEIEEPLVEMSKQILGEQHPDTLSRMHDLANRYFEKEQYDKSLQIEEPLIEMSKQVLGEKHPHTLSRMHTLAVIYWQVGKLNNALQTFELLAEMSKQALGEQHPDTLDRRQILTEFYSQIERLIEAQQMENLKASVGDINISTS
ncbi:hypothetical protein GYMLUDRAFT_264517 [Collybiopsis luxurians FD-317 M1]|uniref:Small ribosomal subunit protein uS15 N-terminal domain-containing protein n=1 Tax=Collybiopsis luxurians FD-317 M1 TaxID=944289 RepID=A0A0D0AVS0_9AGAR|nr:hypothetical protein GYMLUDRAFT_264517 [Collybiopsis luxurians FD-317 M1]